MVRPQMWLTTTIQIHTPNASDHKPVIAFINIDNNAKSRDGAFARRRSPFAIDESAWVKATAGWLMDRVTGSIWRIVALVGFGSDKLGVLVIIVALCAALLSKRSDFNLSDTFDNVDYLYKRIL